MKTNLIPLLLMAGLALLLVGRGPTGQPDPSSQQDPVEADGAPLDITAFSFSHSASYTEGCYALEIERGESGTHIRAEEMFGLERVAEAVIEEDVLAQLGALAGKYHVERWDGFNKSDSMVQDGSSFSLDITLADGSTITARGSNSFPKHYSEIEDAVWALYNDWLERYGVSAAPVEGGRTKRQDPNAPKTIVSTELVSLHTEFFCCDESGETDGGRYTFDLKKTEEGWQLDASGAVTDSVSVEAAAAEQVQALIETHGLVAWNGLYSVTAGLPPEYSPCTLSAAYASGEQLQFTMDGDPWAEWCAAFRDYFLEILSQEGEGEG